MRAAALLPVLAVLATSLVAAPAGAVTGTTYTWVGSTVDPNADHHSWTDARNWSPQGVPGNGDSVIVQQPSPGQCTAHVDNVPTVTLTDFTLREDPALCGSSVHGGAITVTGTFTWNGGNLDSPTTLAAGSTGTVSGANNRLDSLTQQLEVGGSLTLTGLTGTGNGGNLRITAPQVLHVQPGGTLRSQGDNAVTNTSCCVNPARIVNDGTLEVDTGTLSVHAVAVDQKAVLIAMNSGRLLSTGAPVTATDGAGYTGSGSWAIENVSHARFDGTQTFGPDFHLELGGLDVDAGSTFAGTTTLAGSGTFDWTGGTLEANLTVGPSFHVNVSGAHTGNGRRVLAGTDTTVSPVVPVTITNHGALDLGDGAAVDSASGAHVVSDGTVTVAAGTTLGTGAGALSLTGGVLTGLGTVSMAVDNAHGTVRPGDADNGTLHLTSSYRQGSKGRLDLDAGAASRDVLAVTGKASLSGRLAVTNEKGYQPHKRQKYTALTASSLTGSLSCATTSGGGARKGHWQPAVKSTALLLVWKRGRMTSC